MKLYAGFDCGGSSTRCMIIREDGSVLGEGRGGASNYLFLGKDLAGQAIKDAVRGAFEAGGIAEQKLSGVYVASAAVEVFEGASHEPFFKEITGCEALTCDSDILPVWYAGGVRGHRLAPAIAMIAGTGAVTYLLKDHSFIKADGWGPHLGDAGSGYRIGLKALQETAKMADGRLSADPDFYHAVMDFYEGQMSRGSVKSFLQPKQKGGEEQMTVKVVVREGETIDDAMRRFKRGVNKSGILLECRKREAYLKPGLARKMKSKLARRKKW